MTQLGDETKAASYTLVPTLRCGICSFFANFLRAARYPEVAFVGLRATASS